MDDAAERVKAEGNRLYGLGKFSAAAEAYTQAIALLPPAPSPALSVLYSNRGMCAKVRTRVAPGARVRARSAKCPHVVPRRPASRPGAPDRRRSASTRTCGQTPTRPLRRTA